MFLDRSTLDSSFPTAHDVWRGMCKRTATSLTQVQERMQSSKFWLQSDGLHGEWTDTSGEGGEEQRAFVWDPLRESWTSLFDTADDAWRDELADLQDDWYGDDQYDTEPLGRDEPDYPSYLYDDWNV